MRDFRSHRGMQVRRWLAGGVALLAGLLGLSGRADIHVSPDGMDTNPGTRSRPVASLERARDLAREGRAKAGTPATTVWLHAGDFPRTQSLELTAEDSGAEGKPAQWKAWPGDRVRLLGGRIVSSFQKVTDLAIIERLAPEARDHVRVADLRSSGITDVGRLVSRGFTRKAPAAHSELFFGGRPMVLAQWPNAGSFETIAGISTNSADLDPADPGLGSLGFGFRFAGDRPSRWKSMEDVWVHGYWSWDWANSYERIESLDLNEHRIRTAAPHGLYGFRKGQRFYFLNVLEELDQPGEWWIDRQTLKLYFWPPGDAALSAKNEVVISTLDQPFFRLKDARHIQVSGLILEATRGNAVEILGGTRNRVNGCEIRNIGTWAVEMLEGTENGVQRCNISDCGDGGVMIIGGDRNTLTPGGHFVEDCEFRRQGRWSKCYVPAIQMFGVGNRASHNRVQDHPHCGILFWGNEQLIEFNDIHHVALETGDVGAIYTGRDYSFRGNRIRSNFIHETGGVGMGSMGVYMDDCVSGTEVVGNAFWKVHWAMFIGGGRDHQVVGNLFVDCDPALRIDGRGLDPSPGWRDMVEQVMRKNLAAVPQQLYRSRYPAIRTLDAYYGPPGGPKIDAARFQGIPPAGNLVASNVVVGKWLQRVWNAPESALELRGNWLGSSLPFRNERAGDLRPGPGYPLAKLGYAPIPFDQIGPRPSPERRALARLVRKDLP
jgi:hypothetical protein